MATETRRTANRDDNDVQDVEVQGVQRPHPGLSENAYTVRRSAIRAYVVHYAHIKIAGGEYSPKCEVCRGRVAPLLEIVPEAPPEPSDTVVQGDRVDEEETTPPTSSGGWTWDQ